MRILVVLGFILAAVGGYYVYWTVVADEMVTRLDTWITDRLAEGYTYAQDGREVAGFPYRIMIVLRNPAFAAPQRHPAWEWQSDELLLIVEPWALNSVIIKNTTPQHLVFDDGRQPRQFRLSSKLTYGNLIFDLNHGGLQRFSLGVGDGELAEVGTDRTYQIGKAQMIGRFNRGQQADRPDQTGDLAISFSGVDLPQGVADFMARRVEFGGFDARIYQLPPPEQGLVTLPEWRDKGGHVQVQQFGITWGKVAVEGKGRLALDAANRPIGEVSGKIAGYRSLVDALVATGQVKKKQAVGTKLALDLLARTDNDGERRLRVPVKAVDGYLYAGSIRLLALPPLFPDGGQNPPLPSPGPRQ